MVEATLGPRLWIPRKGESFRVSPKFVNSSVLVVAFHETAAWGRASIFTILASSMPTNLNCTVELAADSSAHLC